MNIRSRFGSPARLIVVLSTSSLCLLGLAACSMTSGGTGYAPATTGSAASATPAPAASSAALATASTSLGTVVVDGNGMTVYQYGKDAAGATSSACTGGCATNWPAVESASASPTVTGITGKVGTITGTDGKLQVTLNGLPLYRYAGDSAAGDVNGQGIGHLWYAVAPDGNKISGYSK
ncbi:hypothetical protein ACFPJ4_06560 [Lysinimonas soli]|uniref:Lipoprotein with Yx(FWY)xxD motif n=1 Tax=Lysinimonas soli TaxID=1074233 RepID=A0ABW0NMY0_9MICO